MHDDESLLVQFSPQYYIVVKPGDKRAQIAFRSFIFKYLLAHLKDPAEGSVKANKVGSECNPPLSARPTAVFSTAVVRCRKLAVISCFVPPRPTNPTYQPRYQPAHYANVLRITLAKVPKAGRVYLFHYLCRRYRLFTSVLVSTLFTAET